MAKLISLSEMTYIEGTMKISILVINEFNPNNSPRPSRIINFLKSKSDLYDVSTASETSFQGVEDFYFISRDKPSILSKLFKLVLIKLRLYRLMFWTKQKLSVKNELICKDFDLIICLDLSLLPLVFKIKKNAKIIFDAREYYSRHFEDRVLWNYFYKKYNTYLINEFMTRCDKVLTVSPGLVNEYKKEFGIDSELYLSLPELKYPMFLPYKQDGKISLVHHGNATPSRQIEVMINTFKYLDDNYTLDLYLVKHEEKYYKFLLNEAKKYSGVRILEPVPYSQIHEMLINYDVGVFFVPPSTFNLMHTLPNKLFEFIQAGLAICIGPNPDMADVVKKYNIGSISNDFNERSFAKSLLEMSSEHINIYKKNSTKAAGVLNSNSSGIQLGKILDDIVN